MKHTVRFNRDTPVKEYITYRYKSSNPIPTPEGSKRFWGSQILRKPIYEGGKVVSAMNRLPLPCRIYFWF